MNKMKRIPIALLDFQKGKICFLTKSFVTYNVKYCRINKNNKIVVEIVNTVFIHKTQASKVGVRKIPILNSERTVLVTIDSLWSLKKTTSLDILRAWAKRQISLIQKFINN